MSQLQRAVHDGRCTLSKELGATNPADLGTEHVEAKIITQTWAKTGFVLLKGDSEKTLRAALGQGCGQPRSRQGEDGLSLVVVGVQDSKHGHQRNVPGPPRSEWSSQEECLEGTSLYVYMDGETLYP